MLERRVATLESKLDRMASMLQRMEIGLAKVDATLGHMHMPEMTDIASVKTGIAEVKGRLGGLPSTWQLLLAIIATWASGAAIVFTILRFGVK